VRRPRAAHAPIDGRLPEACGPHLATDGRAGHIDRMTKPILEKLVLTTSTVRALDATPLAQAAGGNVKDVTLLSKKIC
jgi:hypothetical protein